MSDIADYPFLPQLPEHWPPSGHSLQSCRKFQFPVNTFPAVPLSATRRLPSTRDGYEKEECNQQPPIHRALIIPGDEMNRIPDCYYPGVVVGQDSDCLCNNAAELPCKSSATLIRVNKNDDAGEEQRTTSQSVVESVSVVLCLRPPSIVSHVHIKFISSITATGFATQNMPASHYLRVIVKC